MSRQRYCKVSPRIHTGSFGRSIRGESVEMLRAQSLAGYLTSCPHGNAIGVFFLPIGYIETDRGWGVDGASDGVSTLRRRGLIRYDEDSEWVWLVEHFRHEFGEDPKRTPDDGKKEDSRLPLIRRLLAECSQTTHYKHFLLHYLGNYPYLLGEFERPVDGASDGASDPESTPRGRAPRPRARAQHQHQDQDQDQDQELGAGEKERGKEPAPRDRIVCTICAKPSPGRIPKGGDGSALFPFPHLEEEGGRPCDGQHEEGIYLEDPAGDDPDEERRVDSSAPGRRKAKSPTPDSASLASAGVSSARDGSAALDPGRASPKKKSTAAERRAEFDVWWTDYPKQTGKKEALAAWCRIPDGERPAPEKMVEWIGLAKTTLRWRDGYAKGGAPFVNQRAWEDDLAAYNAGGNAGASRGTHKPGGGAGQTPLSSLEEDLF